MGEGIGQARPGVKRGICKGLTHLVTQITALGGERRASLRRQECSGGLETKRKGKGRKKKAFLSSRASMVAQMLRNLPAVWETGLIPGSGISSGEGHGTPLQYSCLENPMSRGAWRATVHGVTKSWTQLK